MTKVRFQIKKNFKDYLRIRKWSNDDLAENLGMSKQQVSQTLSGSIEPSMQFMHRLCLLTNLRIEEVLETVFLK